MVKCNWPQTALASSTATTLTRPSFFKKTDFNAKQPIMKDYYILDYYTISGIFV